LLRYRRLIGLLSNRRAELITGRVLGLNIPATGGDCILIINIVSLCKSVACPESTYDGTLSWVTSKSGGCELMPRTCSYTRLWTWLTDAIPH
jgi:hypothetical protein